MLHRDRHLPGRAVPGLLGAHGGLALNGYPLTLEFTQTLGDGQIQYLERVRLEYPENAPPFDVLLGQFGRRFHPADLAVPAVPGAAYFPRTRGTT
ncbi:MAG: hypothetical protein U0841_08845 [Chloroflexia bacterium]